MFLRTLRSTPAPRAASPDPAFANRLALIEGDATRIQEAYVGSLSDDELKELIDDLKKEENEISYRRRLLHGKIDILKAELQDRLKKVVDAGEASSIVEADLDRLTEILARKAAPPA